MGSVARIPYVSFSPSGVPLSRSTYRFNLMARNVTPRNEDFPKWYQDVIAAGELADHSPVRGCMVIRPTGFAIWEAMQSALDTAFKETGHVNAYFPVLIPESFIHKESEHVEGFSPELAVVSHAGGKDLEERLVVRPTSETIIGSMYSKWIRSYRDLPLLVNQWCNVMRWEMRPRIFLRTSEFLWQEGHTAHETAEEAQEETVRILEIYRRFLEETCAIPVVTGLKPAHEKFPGALRTYTLEAMMQDAKALQSGTSHNLGQNFSKAFDVKFLDRENRQVHAWTTSWGVSTRMIGGLIMTHGDDDGVIVPPNLAPTKCVIVPIYKNDGEKALVSDFANRVKGRVKETAGSLKVTLDEREGLKPGDKFFHWIQRGVPVRIEVGPKDVERDAVTVVRRDNREKSRVPAEGIGSFVEEICGKIQADLFERAKEFRRRHTRTVETFDEFEEAMQGAGGFVHAHWDGTAETAGVLQEKFKCSVRVVPDHVEPEPGKCVWSGKPSPGRVIFAQSY